jgi:thymidylate synthase (FAD)
MNHCEVSYKRLLNKGWSAQQARSVLPNSLKTEINMAANVREWRHIFRLRTAKAAHPQMRELMRPLLDELKNQIPILFDDIQYAD